MDKTAIDAIHGIVAAGHKMPSTDYPAVTLPCDSRVHGLEHFQSHPYRMRAQFKTNRISDFCAYVSRENQEATAVFVDPDGKGAGAVIDYGDQDQPCWGEHRAGLRMRYTPEYEALSDLQGRALTQTDLIDYLEDWAHCLRPHRDGEEISVGEAIKVLRRIDIETARKQTFEEEDFKNQQSALEAIEAKSGAGSIPGVFLLPIAVYEETDPRNIEARLSLRTSGNNVAFRMRIVGQDALMHAVAREIEGEIAERLLDVERIFIGSIGPDPL